MHLRTLCGTRPKQYPLNLKLLAFPPAHDPETALALNFRVTFYKCSTRASVSLFTGCLALYAVSQKLPFRSYLSKSRATLCSRNIIISGLIFSCGAKVAQRFPWTRPRSVSFFAAPPATPASIRPSIVRRKYGRSRGSGSTGPTLFSWGLCRRLTWS